MRTHALVTAKAQQLEMNEWKGIVRAIRTVRLRAVRIILGYIFIAFKSRGVAAASGPRTHAHSYNYN